MNHKILWKKRIISKGRHVKVGKIVPAILHEDGFVAEIVVRFVRWSPTESCVIVDDGIYSKEAWNAMGAACQQCFGEDAKVIGS